MNNHQIKYNRQLLNKNFKNKKSNQNETISALVGPWIGGYVPQGLTALPMLVITFCSLSCFCVFLIFVLIVCCICSLFVVFVPCLLDVLVASQLFISILFSKDLSHEVIILIRMCYVLCTMCYVLYVMCHMCDVLCAICARC